VPFQRGHFSTPQHSWLLSRDTILHSYLPAYMGANDYTPTLPFLEKKVVSKNEIVEKYLVFKDSIESNDKNVYSDKFFRTFDCLKPDKQKVAQVMPRLFQINIIDLNTQEITGYRMRGSPDFSIFKSDMSDSRYYYTRVQADDQYIYALFVGDKISDKESFSKVDEVHVFDWNGNFVKKLRLSNSIREMSLNIKNNRLYGYDDVVEGVVYCYDLARIMD